MDKSYARARAVLEAYACFCKNHAPHPSERGSHDCPEPGRGSWAVLGRLGRSWDHLGVILGDLGPSWGDLKAVRGPLGVILGPLVVILGRLGGEVGRVGKPKTLFFLMFFNGF